MKRFTFVYKLNIYFNRDIRNRSVELAQPKLNTEEIICSSGVGQCDVFWHGNWPGITFPFVLF